MLMKGTQGKPRQKMQKKVKEKINLYTLKVKLIYIGEPEYS